MTLRNKAKSPMVLFSVLFICLFSSQANAGLLKGEVTAKALNVRDSPSPDGKVVGTLKLGDKVFAAIQPNKKWLKILYQGKWAYISSKYVRILELVDSGSDEKCDASNADVNLNIDSSELNCEEGLFRKKGYKNCSVYLGVSAKSTCTNQLHAFIYCQVNYEYTTLMSRGTKMKRTGFTNGNYDFYIDNGYGNTFVELFWEPGGFSDKVTSVKVTNVSCQINNLYD